MERLSDQGVEWNPNLWGEKRKSKNVGIAEGGRSKRSRSDENTLE